MTYRGDCGMMRDRHFSAGPPAAAGGARKRPGGQAGRLGPLRLLQARSPLREVCWPGNAATGGVCDDKFTQWKEAAARGAPRLAA
jgi:hypothetical protein